MTSYGSYSQTLTNVTDTTGTWIAAPRVNFGDIQVTVDFRTIITIVGCGGIGSNLAYLLSQIKQSNGKSKYRIVVIDNDVTDEKFYNRFLFATSHEINMPKVEAVKNAILQDFGDTTDITAINMTFEDYRKSDQYRSSDFLIITTDSIESRKSIENTYRGHVRIIHAGCNLNSVSIYRSTRDLIGDDTPIIEGTSYDVIPDAKTYLMTCVRVIERIQNSKIDIYDEWIPSPMNSIPYEYAIQGWTLVDHDGHKLCGKPFDLQIKGFYLGDRFYKLKSEKYSEYQIHGFIGYDLQSQRFYIYNPDGSMLWNPHTMSGGYQCIGDVEFDIDNNNRFQDIERGIEAVLDSLEIPNLDSALRSRFGYIHLHSTSEDFILDSEHSPNASNSEYSNEDPEPNNTGMEGLIRSGEVAGHIDEFETIVAVGGFVQPGFRHVSEWNGPMVIPTTGRQYNNYEVHRYPTERRAQPDPEESPIVADSFVHEPQPDEPP